MTIDNQLRNRTASVCSAGVGMSQIDPFGNPSLSDECLLCGNSTRDSMQRRYAISLGSRPLEFLRQLFELSDATRDTGVRAR